MLIQDVLGGHHQIDFQGIQLVREHCSQYLKEAAGFPLLKALPASYADFQRVKVRMQKHKDALNEVFDKAFGEEFYNLRQRAVFAKTTLTESKDGFETFYIFPTDGYKILYSTSVTNSNSDYRQVVDTIVEQLEDHQQATELLSDVLKMSYRTDNLCEGIASNAEIIFYGIPFYYAVRASVVTDYRKLFYN